MVFHLVSIISLQICDFMRQNFILTIPIYCTELQISIRTNTLKYVQTCHLELMVHSDRGLLGQAIFMKQFVSGYPVQVVL